MKYNSLCSVSFKLSWESESLREQRYFALLERELRAERLVGTL